MNNGTDGQLALLSPAPPPVPDWCDLRCCDVAVLLADLAAKGERVDLVVADPPWAYNGNGGNVSRSGAADDHYECLPLGAIREHMESARRLAAGGSRCLLWTTWAFLPAVTGWAARYTGSDRVDLCGWRWVSGGSWCKSEAPDEEGQRQGQPGMGYHLRSSESEPFLVLAGSGPHARADVPGAWVEAGDGYYSSKPIAWQAYAVRGWCPPGGLVLDLYVGLGSVARAVRRAGEGRRYVGAEIDPERHAGALALLAQGTS